MSSSHRPLSPHLQIYKPEMTSLMSISHRFTGVILTSGILVTSLVLSTLLWGRACYEHLYSYTQFLSVKLYLLILCYSFYYHLCNGIRHLCWDRGYGFDMKTVRLSGWLTLTVSLILTLITWFLI